MASGFKGSIGGEALDNGGVQRVYAPMPAPDVTADEGTSWPGSPFISKRCMRVLESTLYAPMPNVSDFSGNEDTFCFLDVVACLDLDLVLHRRTRRRVRSLCPLRQGMIKPGAHL